MAWSVYMFEHTQHRKGVTFTPLMLMFNIKLTVNCQTIHVSWLHLISQGVIRPRRSSLYGTRPTLSSVLIAICLILTLIANWNALILNTFEKHPGAVRLLQEFPNLLWLPLATMKRSINFIKNNRQGPFMDSPTLVDCPHDVFYTDGTCDLPCLGCCSARPF